MIVQTSSGAFCCPIEGTCLLVNETDTIYAPGNNTLSSSKEVLCRTFASVTHANPPLRLFFCFWMSETILLCPRPLARYGGRFVLLPLLPQQPHLRPLPVEIWSRIFTLALSADASQRSHHKPTTSGLLWCVSLMLVCKFFRVSPVNRFRLHQPTVCVGVVMSFKRHRMQRTRLIRLIYLLP